MTLTANKTRLDCAYELRALGYNHTAGNNYARLTGRRGMDHARILVDQDGNHTVVELNKESTR